MNEDTPFLLCSLDAKRKSNGDKQTSNYRDDVATFKEKIGHVKFIDSGYSWVVLLMLFFSNILTRGFFRSFGLLVNKISDSYPDASSQLTGAMVGQLTGFSVILAPIAGGLINKCGIRSSIFLGTFLIFVGLVTSSVFDRATYLPLTLCAITGAGLCFVESIQVVAIADYFNEKLSFANGIRVCGKSFGGIVAPLYLVFLLEYFDLKHAYLLIAATLSHTLLVAAVIQPFSVHKRLHLRKLVNSHYTPSELQIDKRSLLVSLENQLDDPNDTTTKKFLEMRILKNWKYLQFILITIAGACGIPLATIYIPIYGDKIGLSPLQNSLVLQLMSTSDMLCRFFLGWVINKRTVSKCSAVAVCMMTGGFSLALIPLTNNGVGLIAAACVYSLAYSSYFEFVNVILCDAFGKDIVATTWGFVHFTEGLTNLIVSYVIGYMMDYSGNLYSTFILMGSGIMISGLLLFWASIYERRNSYEEF